MGLIQSVAKALQPIASWFNPGHSNFDEDGPDFVTPRRAKSALPFNRFSTFLPYGGYDTETQLFPIEGDEPGKPEGWGFVLEIHPQIGASREMADFLTTLFPTGAPAGTGYQLQVFGSPVLDDFFDRMLGCTLSPERAQFPEQARLLKRMTEQRIAFYKRGATTDLQRHLNYRMRNFTCNLSVVVPTQDWHSDAGKREALSLRQQLITTLNQYHLFKRVWDAETLQNYLALVLNPHRTLAGDVQHLTYDDTAELRHQIIAADTGARETSSEIVYTGAGHEPIAIRAMSVRSMPKYFGLNAMAQLLGSSTSSAIGYPCPFLLTVGVTLPAYEASKNATMMKSARAQQSAESQLARFLPNLQDLNEDWKIAQRAFDEGKGLARMYHQLLLFARPDELSRAEQAAQGVWRSERCDLAVDRNMQKQALLSSLPMMFGPLMQRDLKTAQRLNTKTLFNAANMIPVVAEWAGTPPRQGESVSRPVLTLFGRKGQAQAIDIFANPSGNYNGVVVGTSGSGKSVLLNELALRTLATGGRVWIIDVGRSYEKLCAILGGQYIEFTPEADISLNVFSLIKDIDEDMEMLKPLIGQMISPSRPLTDYELAQIEMHIRSCWYEHQHDTTITHLANSLRNNCSMGGPNPQADDPEWKAKVANMAYEDRQKYCDPRIRDLGVQLLPFTDDGAYGKYFKGKSSIDFKSNFIVLELEELKSKKDLQAVVMMLLMYRITQDMYIPDAGNGRKQEKLVIIDEAWDLMGTGNSGSFIEAGYRRARKYQGAFFTGTQMITDYYKNETARAALENADWMFFLRQKPESIEALAESGKLVLDDHTKKLLRSVTTVSGAFSEVFVRGGDMAPAVGRLFVDPFSLLSASSRADEFEAVRSHKERGLSTEEAILAVLADRAKTAHAV